MVRNVSHHRNNSTPQPEFLKQALICSNAQSLKAFSDQIMSMDHKELIESCRQFHEMMLPGTELRASMEQYVSRRFVSQENLSPKEANRRAKRQVHEDFKALEDLLHEFEANRDKPKDGFLGTLGSNLKGLRTAFHAKQLFLKMVVGHIGMLIGALVSKQKNKDSRPISHCPPISSKNLSSLGSSSAKARAQDPSSLPSIENPALAPLKPKKSKFRESIVSLSKARKKARRDSMKERRESEEEDDTKKVLVRAIHDTLMELQRLSPQSNINFSPAIWPFFSKADMTALLSQVHREIARAQNQVA